MSAGISVVLRRSDAFCCCLDVVWVRFEGFRAVNLGNQHSIKTKPRFVLFAVLVI